MLTNYLFEEPAELIGALLLDRETRVSGVTFAPVQRLTQTELDVGALFRVALLTHSQRMMGFRWVGLSVDVDASGRDRQLAERLVAAGLVLGVPIEDFVVVGPGENWISLRQNWPAWPDMEEWSAPLVEPRRRMPVKYRDPATGETWHGGGSTPRWLRERLDQGFDLEDFRVQD